MHAREIEPSQEELQQKFATLTEAITNAFNKALVSRDNTYEFKHALYLINHNNSSSFPIEQKLKNLAMIFTGALINAMDGDKWTYKLDNFFYPLDNHFWDIVDELPQRNYIGDQNDSFEVIDTAASRGYFDKANDIMRVGKCVVEGKLPFSMLMWDEMCVQKAKSLNLTKSKRLFANSDLEQLVQDSLIDGFNIKPTMLKVLSDAINLTNSSSSLHKAGKELYSEALMLTKQLKTEADKHDLAKSLYLATLVLRNPLDVKSIKALQLHANTSAIGKPVIWKKLIGAIGALVGVAMIALSIAGLPLMAGASLGCMSITGLSLAVGGAALLFSGTQAGLAKSLDQLAKVGDKEIKSTAAANLTP